MPNAGEAARLTYTQEVMDVNERIRLRVRDEMTRQGITQAELARRLGVKQPSIAQIMSGKRGTIPQSLMDMLEALGLTLEAVALAETVNPPVSNVTESTER